jgi:outer membrane protein
MKNVSIIVNILLAIAIGVLFFLHFTSKSESKPELITNDIASDTKISSEFSAAWVNIDTVFNNFDMYFDMRKDLEEKGKKMETEMNNRTRVLEKEMMDFQNKAQKGLLLRSEIQQKQQELAEKEQELYRFRDELRMKFAEEEQVKLRQIQHTITEFLNEYNKDKGYYLIFSSTFGGPLLYGHPAIDITPEVLKGLNDKYVSTRKEKN